MPLKFFRRLTDNATLKSLGPGLITGAADDDPSGIATYSSAGAALGTSLLSATASLDSPQGVRGVTFKTLFGLLACTGLRISEALRLRPQDFDPANQTLLIEPSKFSPRRKLQSALDVNAR